MLTPATTDRTLLAENAELRARLEEAQEMLRAIRAGEVDALVVEGDAGPALYTLQGVDAEENRLRGEMLAQVSDAVVAVDTGDCIMYLNAVGERLYGVRSADVLGCKRPEVYTRCWSSPEDEARMDAALSARGEWRGELVHRARDGREFPVEVSLTVLRGADGEYKGRIATIRDVTSRKKIEQEKAEALRLLDTLLTRAPVGFVFLDRDLRFVRINERFAEMNGLSVAAHLGRSVAEIIPALEATVREVTARVLATGQPVLDHEFIGETAHAPGITRHWNESWYPVRDERGEIIGFGAVVEDVTERRKSEAVLRLTNERFDLAVKASKVVLFQQDLELRYQWIENPAPGFDGAQVFGKRDADLMERAEDAAVTGALKREVIRSGVGVQQEVLVYIQNAARHFDLLVEPVRDAAGLISGVTCAAIDITERKRAEEARHEIERNYRALAAASSEVAYRMSADWSTMLPLDGRQLVASSDQPLADWAWLDQNLPRDEHPRVRQAISDAIARKTLFELEHRVRHPDGSIGWTLSRAVPILDENEKVIAWFGAASDITERKQAEERLRASEARLRRVFESNVVGMVRWDLDRSMILDANAEFLRMTGYVRDDIASGRLNFRDLTPPEWAARNEESIHAIRANGQAPPYEKEYFHKDGSRLPLLIAGTRFEDSPSEGMSFLIDLTEMKQAEAVLRDRTELLNGVLEGTTDVIFAKDRNGRLLLANAAFAAAARSTPEQLVGKTDEAWFPPDVAAAVRQQDEAVIAHESPMQFEDTVPVAGEARSFLTLKAPLRDGSNRVIGILGISRDITERKRIELNLVHATAVAEKANRAKSDFLSAMSHELRTPLNAILGFAQLLESGAPALAPGQMRNVEQVLKGGWYLLELINEILDFAVIESGKLSLTLEPVSLAEVMLECQDMSEPQARRRGIDMTFPSFDVQGYVRADRTRLKQIVINLLSNAIKYNKAQGAVAVEWTLRPPDSIRISVRDTGEGLSQQQLAQLFQPFNRLGREAGAEEGTGIGLVLTKRLAEMMGGAVGAESVVGVGSVFWFELKLASAPQAALHEAEGSAQPPPRVPAGTPLRNVVYVEDNPANLALMEQLIARRPDLRLLSATDGNRGIELTRAHQPQVILLDVNLPGISGIEVMKILRADPSTAHIPIVALSANALPRDIEDGIKAGFFNYLTKPLKVTQFMEALDLALDYSQFAPGRAIGKEPD